MIPQEEETRIGALISGKYRLEQRLGAGAVGEVFRARNVLIGRDVAIKFLRREHVNNEELVERFVREAQAVSRVRHPHVVDVIDVGVEDDAPYIVQELLLGEDLCGHVNRKGGRVPARAALELLLPAIDGVAHAHDRGVVHRDLKPENIFLARTDDGVVPKVLDFGISKVKTGNLRTTVTGSVFGTPGYMPPEQVRSFADADARADVWALGVILYELVAGRIPFDAQEPNALMLEVCTRTPTPLAEAAPDAPADFAAIVDRCLAKDPADRFADAGALADALRKLADAPERVTRLQFVKASLPPPVFFVEDDSRISLDNEPLVMLQALPTRASIVHPARQSVVHPPRASIVQPARPSIVGERPWALDLPAAARGLDADSTLAGATILSRPPAAIVPPNRLPALTVGLALVAVGAVAFLASQNNDAREAPVTVVAPRPAARPPAPAPQAPAAPELAAPDAASPAPASAAPDAMVRPAVSAPAPRRRPEASAWERAMEPAARPPSPAPPATVPEGAPAPARVSTAALESAVRRTSAMNMGQVASCIARARDEDPALAGRLSVRLTLAPDGAVREATPVAPRPMQPFARCLARAMSTWNVGPTGAASDTVLTWPYELAAR